ncbi:MAG: hypothetical protein H0U65_00105 [Rubrobacter sp.]|nr:hypothetical protein [Rubrobacter sp.]
MGGVGVAEVRRWREGGCPVARSIFIPRNSEVFGGVRGREGSGRSAAGVYV